MDFNEHQRARLEGWWQALDTDARQRLLALDERASIPEDIVPSLYAARVTFVTTWWEATPDDAKRHQPQQMLDFLAEKRQEQ